MSSNNERIETTPPKPERIPGEGGTLAAYGRLALGLAAVITTVGLYGRKPGWEDARAKEESAEKALDAAKNNPNVSKQEWHKLEHEYIKRSAERLDLETND